MPYYPSVVKNDFTTKTNFTDTILAGHVNDLQGEVTAIESNLGTSLNVSGGFVGSFDQITTTWSTLKDRIQNIEYGLGTAYNTSTSTLGGSTIESSTTSTTSLAIKAKASQTANLLELQTSDGTVVSKVDASGNIYTSNKQVVPIVYAASQPSSVPAGTIWVDSSSSVATFTAQSGIPSGGTTGQYLTKVSDDDYDTQWSSLEVPDQFTPSFFLGGM